MWKRFAISYRGGRVIYINLPQTEMWKIISYGNTYPFDQFKCGRDLQYPTGVKELVKCGRKTGACIFSPNHTEIFLKVECGR
jgi:hypothetical protein